MSNNRSWCSREVIDVLIKANELWNLDLDIPSINFYSVGKAAGKAFTTSWRLEFNEVLLNENKEHFTQTIIHEVAHLVTEKLYPHAKQMHGPEFKYVIHSLGGEVKTYHNYDITNIQGKKQKRHQYSCCKCNNVLQISTTLHNRLQNDENYVTRCCKQILTKFHWQQPSSSSSTVGV